GRVINQYLHLAEFFVFLFAMDDSNRVREFQVLKSLRRHQDVLVGLEGVFEQSMNENDIDASEFFELAHAMEQGLAAVDDQFELEFLDVLAGIALAVRGLREGRDPFGKGAEKSNQLFSDFGFLFLPDARVTLNSIKKNGVPFQLGNFQRHFDLLDNRLNQLGDDRLAVSEAPGVGNHEAGVPADVRNHQENVFCRRFGGDH